MSTQLSPNTSEDHSTVGTAAADQQLLAMGMRLNELLQAVAPFVKLFNQAAAREDKPMLTNGTTEAVIANKDLRRLAYAAEDAATIQSAQPSQAAPALTTEHHGLDTAERVCFYEQDFYVLSNFSQETDQPHGVRRAQRQILSCGCEMY